MFARVSARSRPSSATPGSSPTSTGSTADRRDDPAQRRHRPQRGAAARPRRARPLARRPGALQRRRPICATELTLEGHVARVPRVVRARPWCGIGHARARPDPPLRAGRGGDPGGDSAPARRPTVRARDGARASCATSPENREQRCAATSWPRCSRCRGAGPARRAVRAASPTLLEQAKLHVVEHLGRSSTRSGSPTPTGASRRPRTRPRTSVAERLAAARDALRLLRKVRTTPRSTGAPPDREGLLRPARRRARRRPAAARARRPARRRRVDAPDAARSRSARVRARALLALGQPEQAGAARADRDAPRRRGRLGAPRARRAAAEFGANTAPSTQRRHDRARASRRRCYRRRLDALQQVSLAAATVVEPRAARPGGAAGDHRHPRAPSAPSCS